MAGRGACYSMIQVKFRRRSLWLFAGLATALTGCGRSKDPHGKAGAAGPQAERVVPVQIAPARRQDLPVWIEGLGNVAAVQQVTVRTQVDGRLDKVLFAEGQAVHKGDVIAQIDPRPFLVQLHEAEGALARDRAQLDVANKNVTRYRELHAQNLVAQQQVDQYVAQAGQLAGAVEIDQAQVDAARLNLDYAAIKAPLDGVAGVRLVDAGNIVHPGDANGLVVITAIDPAAVFITLPEDELPRIASALARGTVPVRVLSRDGSKQLGEGAIAVLDNQIDEATATLRLKALIPNPDRTLWPKEFVKARLRIAIEEGATVVPAVAVQQGPNGPYVYVVGSDDTAQLRQVTVALTTDDDAVITKGVQAGEQVVTEGASQLRPGGKVSTPKPDDKGAGAGGGGSGGHHGKPGQRSVP